MISLRESFATLPTYLQGLPVNVGAVAEYALMDRPVSLTALAEKIVSLPESKTFHSIVETGAALGGEVTITLHRDGHWRFEGFMRATGAFSFSFRIGVVVRSASGQITVAAQHSGKVFGSDTPGERQNNWNEAGTNRDQMKVISNLWPDILGGKMVVSRTSDLSGVAGTAVDVVKDVAEFLLAAETLGGSLAICLIIGSELGNLGVTVPGLGGVVGLGIVAGSLFIWGPLSIGPAILIGVAVGAIVDALVKIRRLTEAERNFAREVFGDSLDFDRIRLTNLLGVTGTPFTVPTVDNTILINIGDGITFDRPIDAILGRYAAPGQILIHELTHAWQIQHASLEDGYVPGYLCRGTKEQVIDGKAAYTYGATGASWHSFGLEGQASIVDQWFGGNGKQSKEQGGRGIAKDLNSEYFRYIDNDIRAAVL